MDTLESRIPEQIDIMVNEECNAKCGMCIQEITYKSGSDSEENFMDSVRKNFGDFYELGGRKVIITGGEPTLRPDRIERVLQELSEYDDLGLIAMYTNGSRLLKKRDGETIAQRLLNAGLQFANLSIHHYDTTNNNAVFGIEKDDPRDVSAHLREIGLPFRYCATLQKGGLETTEDVLDYIDFARQNGAVDVYLRQMFEVQLVDTGGLSPKRLPVVKKGLEYIRKNFVDVRPIIEDLESQGCKVEESDYFQGRKKHETRFQIPGGYSFFISTLEIGNETAKEFPYLVVMPNGGLYSTWMGETSRIDSLRG
jgi:MoaA/NifB/PqqE/SkfB family radical SAM enzyme